MEIVRIGSPVGIIMGLEIAMFSVAAVMMGFFGVEALAAHQVGIQWANVLFTVPHGVSQATSIQVAQALGANQIQMAKRQAYIGIALGILAGVITALLFIFGSRYLVGFFINGNNVSYTVASSLAISFIGVAAVMQFLDGIQVILNGALRALKDTFVPMVLSALSYWGIGIFGGWILAFHFGWGGLGLWYGLTLGIGGSMALLMWRLISQFKSISVEI